LLPALFCALACCVAPLRASGDPGAQFLLAYQAFQAATKLEVDGKAEDARKKYAFCESLLEQVQKDSPSFQPIVIDYRLQKTRDALARLQSDQTAGNSADTASASALPSNPEDSDAGTIPSDGPAASAAVPSAPAAQAILRLPLPVTPYRVTATSQTPVQTSVPAFAPAPAPAADSRLTYRGGDDSLDNLMGRGAFNALKDEIRSLQLRLEQQKRANDDLNQRLLDSTAREQSALTALDRTKVQGVEIQAQLEQVKQSLEDMQQSNDKLTAEKKAADQQIAGLQADLDSAHADLEVANDFNGELSDKLDKAAQYIDASEKIRMQLLGERKELSGMLVSSQGEVSKLKKGIGNSEVASSGAAAKLAAQNKELSDKLVAAEKQLDSLSKQQADQQKIQADAAKLAEEKKALSDKLATTEQQLANVTKSQADQQKVADDLRAQVVAANKALAEKNDAARKQTDDTSKLVAENQALSAKLAATERQLEDLSKDRGERQKIEASLHVEVDAANKSLTALRDQLKTGQEQIADLEKQLKDTASANASATGAVVAENALLKSLVTRELEEQVKRQEARKLVEEEMEKLQLRSTSLDEKLQSLANAETPLTPQERKIFGGPALPTAGGTDFTMAVPRTATKSDLPPELVNRAKEANDLSHAQRFAEAKDIYADIQQKAPNSYIAAVNLGIAQRHLGDYAKAIEAFQHALDLQPGDAFALTNLGDAEYRNGQVGAAVDVLKKAVDADSQSYFAHYLLGLALRDNGDVDEARHEVQQALSLKPDYVPAARLEGELNQADSSTAAPKAGATSAR
jgi:predicted  nucleic acid-binding Zn-ribbon protein